ncbi:MAG: hypothetical protein LBI62_07860 [Candidatus Accumulibacter sp.]|jgi:hypothetical protein|nr:hypothetical protein [Accumulibacter sp.]
MSEASPPNRYRSVVFSSESTSGAGKETIDDDAVFGIELIRQVEMESEARNHMRPARSSRFTFHGF